MTETKDKRILKLLTPERLLILALSAATAVVYFLSNPHPYFFYDYTFRVAENLWRGQIGLPAPMPPHLNEMIPFEGLYYSAFPLGAVLTYLPFSLLKIVGLVEENPASLVVALTAGGICYFLLQISSHYELSLQKRILLALAILFGTWTWTNLLMAGAWHAALGFAMLGELGAIYYTVYRRRAFLAGIFFALAFGNRTEILLTAPIFMFLLAGEEKDKEQRTKNQEQFFISAKMLRKLALFCAIPFALGVSTLIYNYVRFHHLTDFGYARIPGVLNEPWYRYGIFAFSYIPLNIREMLATQWKYLPHFPFFVPTGFGGAIWWSSPFLIFLFRSRVRHKLLWRTAWAAIAILTFLLWTHGNPGGWQFGYRYAMVLLPWIYLILLENSPEEITLNEILAYGVSFLVNAWATYLFFWTDYVKP